MKISITETCLYAESLEKAEHFYSEVMGFELVMKEKERHLFYKCENGMLLIFNPRHTSNVQTEVNGKPVPLHGAKGPGHIAFSVENDAYDEWKTRLRKKNIEIESEIEWPGNARSFYFRDPAGNSLEIITGNMWKLS
jgi:catechol 2,3-dioxygenase-like lactoylglutathione lyase family enzyme